MRQRFLLASLLLAPLTVQADPAVTIVPLDFPVTEMRGPESHTASVMATSDALRANRALERQPLVAVWGRTGGAALAVLGGELRAFALGPSASDAGRAEAPRGAIPDARRGVAGPITAHFGDPTEDYPHGVLGDAVEASTLVVSERLPVAPGPGAKPVPIRTSRVPAGPGAVFEDLEPRLADLDGDGTPEILVVKSYLDRGSALAVIGRREAEWQILAETPPVGEPNRWLNPAVMADLDGDGRLEIALVRTPHRDGILQVWAFAGGRLELKREAPGYSNHALGSTALALAAAVDIDGDGVPELAIPTLDRCALAILSLKVGIEERRRVPLPARALTGVAALGAGRETRILVCLEYGRLAEVRP